MSKLLKRFVREEDGASLVEYSLMVALIAVVCLLVISALGQEVGESFDKTQKAIRDGVGTPVPVTP